MCSPQRIHAAKSIPSNPCISICLPAGWVARPSCHRHHGRAVSPLVPSSSPFAAPPFLQALHPWPFLHRPIDPSAHPSIHRPNSFSLGLHLDPDQIRPPPSPMASALVPIQPNSLQWFVSYTSTYAPVSCLSAATPSELLSNLGDSLLLTNRCLCSKQSSPTVCSYITRNPTSKNLDFYSCGSDAACKKGCKLDGSLKTTSSLSCNSALRTVLSTQDYTSPSTWDPHLNTPYFLYYTYASNDATCSILYEVYRFPVYPTCTHINGSAYGLSLLNPTSHYLELFACSDPRCNTCHFVRSDYVRDQCVLGVSADEQALNSYVGGARLNNPNVVISSTFPNQTFASTSSSSVASVTQTSASSNSASLSSGTVSPTATVQPPPDIQSPPVGLIAGISTAAGVLVAGVIALFCYRRNYNRNHQATSAADVTSDSDAGAGWTPMRRGPVNAYAPVSTQHGDNPGFGAILRLPPLSLSYVDPPPYVFQSSSPATAPQLDAIAPMSLPQSTQPTDRHPAPQIPLPPLPRDGSGASTVGITPDIIPPTHPESSFRWSVSSGDAEPAASARSSQTLFPVYQYRHQHQHQDGIDP
ncbi:uncharacterized protein BJ171DRAFT_521647 [Polychytrium aggregatum]|uniref:uncharacterized protein n=1 Tax=Polychytrium aggregatum TaxID=110093 RepID=UPI0022FEE2B4|nr:uncharacterized protein BJ171DRAFT_521647 [Polychytrium aggregatum]KAI9197231.1 hypothetical protein BJ171DRAFT_521647 [Polychytrium aggregatum]